MNRKATGRMANRDQRVKWLREQNLFSNVFMSVALRDVPACQHVLRTLLESPHLAVHAVRTRYRISNLLSKDSELDVLAEDADGQMYNIEIQRTATVDHARRLRYYGAQIDSGFLEKGARYQDLPNVYLVYISETDLWKLGLTACPVCKSLLGRRKYEDGIQILYEDADGQMYNIEIQRTATVDHARRLRYYGAQIDSGFLEKGARYQDLPNVYLVYISETDLWKLGLTACPVCKSLLGRRKYEDGIQILYVNAGVDDGSEQARLMRFFQTADPEDQSQGALSARVHFLKKEEGGRKEMEAVVEEIFQDGVEAGREEGREEGVKTVVFHLFARGDSLEEIHGVADMPLAQLEQWKEEWERGQEH